MNNVISQSDARNALRAERRAVPQRILTSFLNGAEGDKFLVYSSGKYRWYRPEVMDALRPLFPVKPEPEPEPAHEPATNQRDLDEVEERLCDIEMKLDKLIEMVQKFF